MHKILIFLLLSSPCWGADEEWVEQVKARIDQQAVKWLREKLRQDFQQKAQPDLDLPDFCKNCFLGGISQMDPKIYVFMSFEVPEETWLQLAHELEKFSGIFVVKGLPNNSFQDFANRLLTLKRKGMSVDIQVNPELFNKYHVKEAPTFVMTNGETDKFLKVSVYPGTEEWDKISGNISLTYALNTFANGSDRAKEDFYSSIERKK